MSTRGDILSLFPNETMGEFKNIPPRIHHLRFWLIVRREPAELYFSAAWREYWDIVRWRQGDVLCKMIFWGGKLNSLPLQQQKKVWPRDGVCTITKVVQKNHLWVLDPHPAVFPRGIFKEFVPEDLLEGLQHEGLGSVGSSYQHDIPELLPAKKHAVVNCFRKHFEVDLV